MREFVYKDLFEYSIFARGADGGSGLYKHSGGKGSLVRATFWFQEGDTIFVSVGQSGANACSEVTQEFEACKSVNNANITTEARRPSTKSKMDVGGGGGGATYGMAWAQSRLHHRSNRTPSV